jgi:hypothetical protein
MATCSSGVYFAINGRYLAIWSRTVLDRHVKIAPERQFKTKKALISDERMRALIFFSQSKSRIRNQHPIHSLGAASFLASRLFCRRARRDAACFSRLAFRLTFFFASISFRFDLVADFVVAMIFQCHN